MYYAVRFDSSLCHSSGPWKNHKYVKKVGNKYYYASANAKAASAKEGYDAGKALGQKAAALLKSVKAKWFSFSAKALAKYNNYVAKGKAFASGFANSFAYETSPKAAASRAANARASKKVEAMNEGINKAKSHGSIYKKPQVRSDTQIAYHDLYEKKKKSRTANTAYADIQSMNKRNRAKKR